jgi:N-acetylglucosaminyldiphosphoundecaprenol N-acetyl-beta-D-mannosaminyltransferase
MSNLSAVNRTRHRVLGYPVDIVDETQALAIIADAWARGRGMHVVTLNAEMVVAAQHDAELDRIIRRAHLIVPDGAGVVFAVKLAGQSVCRLPGIELAAATLRAAAERGCRVALLGGKPETMEALLDVLPQRFAGLNIVHSRHGYFSLDEQDSVIEDLVQHEPQLLLVALGVPKQEYFIDKLSQCLPHTIKIGVGGSFDVWTGQVKRAPEIMRRFSLEWLYRLYKEPWRFNRMMTSLPKFFIQVLCGALAGSSAAGADPAQENGNGSKNIEKKE